MYKNNIPHPVWRKSARSFANNECVEVAQLASDEVGLRDTKPSNLSGCPMLRADTATWEGFTAQLKSGNLRR